MGAEIFFHPFKDDSVFEPSKTDTWRCPSMRAVFQAVHEAIMKAIERPLDIDKAKQNPQNSALPIWW